MTSCAAVSQDTGWAADHPNITLLAVGVAAEIEAAGLETGALVRMLGGDEAPTLWSWAISELDADIALGLTASEGSDIIGDGMVNLFYCSDGRLISNGAVVRTGPALKAGDSLVLYLDRDEAKACFLLNGVAV